MTAFEVKSLFGRAAATAKKKCMNLYDYGLCLIFQMSIQAEEQIWKREVTQLLSSSDSSFAKQFIKQIYPQAQDKAIVGLIKEIQQTQVVPKSVMQAIADSDISLPVSGLQPVGDSTVLWRWTGPVYEESSQDMLNKSIVGRNMAEDGVDRWSVLRFIYPDKTEEELKEMTGAESSIPFRRIQQTVQAIQMILGVHQQMGGLPNPGNPAIPLNTVINLLPSVQKIVEKLTNDIFVTAPVEPANESANGVPTGEPTDGVPTGEPTGEPTDGVPTGVPTSVSNEPADGSTYASYLGTTPSGFQQSVEGGVQSTIGVSESADRRAFPEPNARIAPRTNRLQYKSITSPTIPTIPTDMGNQPGLLRQLFPSVYGAIDAAKSKSGKPKKQSKE
jgi:hypothetical protein